MILRIKVKPNAHSDTIKKETEGTYLVSVQAVPVEGKANKAVQEFLSDFFNIPRSQIILKKGMSSRYKSFELPDSPDILRKLAEIP